MEVPRYIPGTRPAKYESKGIDCKIAASGPVKDNAARQQQSLEVVFVGDLRPQGHLLTHFHRIQIRRITAELDAKSHAPHLPNSIDEILPIVSYEMGE